MLSQAAATSILEREGGGGGGGHADTYLKLLAQATAYIQGNRLARTSQARADHFSTSVHSFMNLLYHVCLSWIRVPAHITVLAMWQPLRDCTG